MPISAMNLLLEERTVKDENNFVFLNFPIIQNLVDIQRLIIVTEFYHCQNSQVASISSPPYCNISCGLLSLLGNTSLAAKGALANRLQRRTACKIQNGRQGAPKWQRGSGKVSNPRFLGILSNFFDPSTPSMRKITRRTTGAKGNKFVQVITSFNIR